MVRRKAANSLERLTLTALLLAVLVSVMVVACDPWAPIVIINKTDQSITAYFRTDDNLIGAVQPGKELEVKGLMLRGNDTYDFVAKDTQGRVIYVKSFTEDDLFKIDFKIVIAQKDIKIPK